MDRTVDFKAFYDVFRHISAVVHSSTHVGEVLELVVWKCSDILGGKGALLRSLNKDSHEFELFASYGLSEDFLATNPCSNKEVITDLCWSNKVDIITDILNDKRIRSPQMVWDKGFRMVLDSPLRLRDESIGIIRTYFSEPRTFFDEELDFAVAIADQCACALEKARLMEEQRSRYNHLASRTNKLSALGRMAAGIAHEINNPLAGILLFSTNLVKKAPEEGQIKDGLEVITREALRCKGIIQDLLEFSRDKDPKKNLSSINGIIEKALSILENEFRLRHISLEKDLSKEMPDVLVDVDQMQQVFINIFLNAIEASNEGGSVSVKTFTAADQKHQIIGVEDTGNGISTEDIEKVFDPFFSTKTNGTGLGLAVSYGIIEKHSGRIQITSQPGQGTRIEIEIPNIQ
ncbi:ATP-binding protein [Thermodesulfobacteriota bacterium]